MKKTLLLIIAGFSLTTVQSQEISVADALRYAQDNMSGTARFRAMSGAFGALGGDLSSININPAGSAVFTNNQFGITLSNHNTKNTTNYFGTKTTESNNFFDLNQAGAVFVFDNGDQGSDWNKFTIAVNYDNVNDFDNSLFTAGTNPTNSVGNYFLGYANQNGGIDLDLLTLQNNESITDLYRFLGRNYGFYAEQAFLGYQGFIIDPASDYSDTNRNYVSLVPVGGNYYQENSFQSAGYNGKLSFNAATQYKDKFYFGLNLNSHFTDYRQTTSFYESNSNNLTSGVQRLRFNNEVYTYGNGFSFQLGAIAKVTSEVRLGLAYESPTWLRLNDELTQNLAVISADTNGELPADLINPRTTNIYDTYKLQTPGKWTGSFAYIFGTTGLISIDYALKDYSNTQFSPNEDYRSLNNSMSSLLNTSGELRIGAEYRINSFSLRGGFRNEQSPYKDGTTVGDLNGFSAGLGYNLGSTKLDLAYSYAQRDYQQQFFVQGMTDRASISSVINTVSLSLLFAL